MTALHSPAEVDGFLDDVNEVSRLIEGLKAGTISPEYVDTKYAERTKRQQKQQEAARPSAPTAQPAPDAVKEQQQDAAKQAELMRKVEELKASRAKKLLARHKYQQYVQERQGGQAAGTDYDKWDLWCPSDEEDDLFNSLTPNAPEFRAMEKDIDERHKRMVAQRQLAERWRVAGNEAYSQGQWSEALRCYGQGLEAQRHSMALHANAAMACLKLKCYVQAMEHCDKVLHLAEMLHNKPKDPLCVKAYQRRATAQQAMERHKEAVQDLENAAAIEPSNAEVVKQLNHARLLLEEDKKQRQLVKVVSSEQQGDAAAGAGAADVSKLQQVECLAAALAGNSSAGRSTTEGSDTSSPTTPGIALEPWRATITCDTLRGLLHGDDNCCVYFRQCEGLKAAAQQLCRLAALPTLQGGPVVQPPSSETHAALTALLLLLNEACFNDANLELLPSLGVLSACVQQLSGDTVTTSSNSSNSNSTASASSSDDSVLNGSSANNGSSASTSTSTSSNSPAVAAAAVVLLGTASTNDAVRPYLCKALCSGKGQGLQALFALLGGGHGLANKEPALALLSNCMLSKQVKDATAALLMQQPAALQPLLALAGPTSSSTSSGSGSCYERVLHLLSNKCGDKALRRQLAGDLGLISVLVKVGLQQAKPLGLGAASSKPFSLGGAPSKAQVAAMGCLVNLSQEPAVQQALSEGQTPQRLLQLACSGTSTQHGDAQAVVAARAASVLARVAKQGAGAGALRALGAEAQLVAALAVIPGAAAPAPKADSAAHVAQMTADQLTWLDGVVRALAALTASGTWCSSCSGSDAATAIAALLQLLQGGSTTGSVLLRGNAALCLSHIAREARWLPLLAMQDAVAALVRVAYEGKGDAASKNAAIALARMARDEGMMARLRELHGFEIIYQYVKPAA